MNPTKDTITVAGVNYVPAFPFESLCRMQEEHGVNAFDADQWVASPRLVAVLVWGACIMHKPDLKLAEVKQSIPLKDSMKMHNIVVRALLDALPEAEKKPETEDGQPSQNA